MSGKKCYHFTRLNRAYGIQKNGLVSRLEDNSKAVNDKAPKISFSDGKMAALGLFANFYDVYTDMNMYTDETNNEHRRPNDKKIVQSAEKFSFDLKKGFEEYLGPGPYLLFDGTNIENTGGNRGKENKNPFDAATKIPIPPSHLQVCGIRNIETNEISFSKFDYIKFLIANLTPDDIEYLRKIDEHPEKDGIPEEQGIIEKQLETYRKDFNDDIKLFQNGNYEQITVDLDEFCEMNKEAIDLEIIQYIQIRTEEIKLEIENLRKEINNFPIELQEIFENCSTEYLQKLANFKNEDLTTLNIPFSSFYETYKEQLDNYISNYTSSIAQNSQDEITAMRAEIDDMKEYENLFLHSSHHIKNVVEFAYIIGKTEDTLGEDLELLVQAAKYHDSGREESEWLTDNHADPSAEHAGIELSKTGKYSPEQIAMIKVAIRYHEHSEKFKNEFDEKYFKEIAEKEGVPKEKINNTKLMCIYLKDADALDRVRLGNLDTSYLRTLVAKSDFFLREHEKNKENISWDNAGIAVKRNQDFDINEQFRAALELLKIQLEDRPDIIEKIKEIEKDKTPEKVIKKIRKVNPQKTNKDVEIIRTAIREIPKRKKVTQMVNDTCSNTHDIQTDELIAVAPERNQEFINAIMNLGKEIPIDIIRKKLEDVIRLSQIEPRVEQNYASVAYVNNILKVISEGMNDNRQVTFTTEDNPGEIKKGFLKSNLIPAFNDTTLAMEKIGQTLGVAMAKTYITNFEGKRFIISEDVAGPDKKLLTMQQFNKEYGSEWPHAQNTDEKMKNLIQYQIQSVRNYGASKEDCDKFKKDYIRMICFDYITNQTDRNDGNYGVLLDENGGISLAPIFDSDYVLNDPSATENSNPFSLNKKYDKDDGLRALFDLYPDEMNEFLQLLNDKENEIMTIAENYLSHDMLNGKGNYKNILLENISKFRSLTLSKKHENQTYVSMESAIKNAGKQIATEHLNESILTEQREIDSKMMKGVAQK